MRGIPATGADTLLQQLLNTAADVIDNQCNTRFVSTAVSGEEHSGNGGRVLQPDHRPVISVSSITVDDETLSSSEYELVDYRWLEIPKANTYNARLRSYTGAWSEGTNNISLSYTYGYAAVPTQIKLATMKLAAAWYLRDGNYGIKSESMGPRSVTYSDETIPPDVRALLDPYVESGVKG